MRYSWTDAVWNRLEAAVVKHPLLVLRALRQWRHDGAPGMGAPSRHDLAMRVFGAVYNVAGEERFPILTRGDNDIARDRDRNIAEALRAEVIEERWWRAQS